MRTNLLRIIFCRQYLLILMVMILVLSCKKDTPDDLPDWLNSYIQDCKRGVRNCCKTTDCSPIRIYRAAAHGYAQVFILERSCIAPSTEYRMYLTQNGDTLCKAIHGGFGETDSTPVGCDSILRSQISGSTIVWPLGRQMGPNCEQ
jgi:hypothetical protein